MTWPSEYQQACVHFERFMVAARDAADLATTNQAWTMVEGVLLAFRRRLTTSQIVEFANVLPPLLRALFLNNWQLADAPRPFASREIMTTEVQDLRRAHNFSPTNAIEAVAKALRCSLDEALLNEVLATFPKEAAAFWAVPAIE
jgi:uncharacterized protein (DUF2267 family)